MRLFTKSDLPRIKAIKLYSLGDPSERNVLVSCILASIEKVFGTTPAEFDIHGPYGVKKGTTIGLESFQKMLSQKGHDKYYALSGETSNQFGFNLVLGARCGETSYSELILWYDTAKYEVEFIELVRPLLAPLNASCGFDVEIPSGHSVTTETAIKRSLFGSISVEANGRHLAWLSSVSRGGIRALFSNNILNSKQLANLPAKDLMEAKPVANDLYYLPLVTVSLTQELRHV